MVPELANGALRHGVSGKHLVPAHDAAALLLKVRGEIARHPRLQILDALHALAFHKLLTCGTALPQVGKAFVAADVDHLGRKDIADIVKRPLDEPECLGIAGTRHTPDLVGMEPTPETAVRLAAGEFGIRARHRAEMAGEFDLRDNRDMQAGRVGDDFLDLRLGVVLHGVLHGRIPSLSLVAGGVREKLRITGNRQRPKLIVRQMPVQHVKLVPRHLHQDALDDILVEERARAVEMHTPPAEDRSVLDLKTRIPASPVNVHERSAGVERAGIVRTANGYSVRTYRQLIALRRD